MDLKKLFCSAAVAGLALTGCKDDSPATNNGGNDGGVAGDMGNNTAGEYCSGGATATGGMTKTYVISALASGRLSNDNKIAGFNLDNSTMGVCDTAADPNGVAPDNFTGVDNTFGTNLVDLISLAVPDAGDDLSNLFTTNINDGTILIILEVSGIDSFQNDNCVAIKGYLGNVPGGGAPMTTGGSLTPGQTLDIDPASIVNGQPLISFSSAGIVNGRLDVTPSDFPLTIPIGTTSLNFTVRETHLRFNITENAITQGMLGGALRITDIVQALTDLQERNEELMAMDMATINLPVTPETAQDALEMFADLEPGSSGGPPCESISVGLTLGGVPVVANAPN